MFCWLALTEPGHGYAVMERVGQLSHGRVQVDRELFTPLLGRFEKEG